MTTIEHGTGDDEVVVVERAGKEWLPMGVQYEDETHLYRYWPDPGTGGAYLTDDEGAPWEMRWCVVCDSKWIRSLDDD